MLPGRTYTLTDHTGGSTTYYKLVREVADRSLDVIPGEVVLREEIRNASGIKRYSGILSGRRQSTRKILQDLENTMLSFLPGVDEHLRNLSVADRFDPTIRTTSRQYLFYMLEIELTNRINRAAFLKAPWRMGLIAHCLRDFRKDCRSRRGDIEDVCTYCNSECHVKRSSELLSRYQVHPYISVSMDHRRLFKKLMGEHPGMGVLGVACIPELVTGLRLCEKLGIPAVGVPLDANRCLRWLGESLETTFSLGELERLVKPETRD